MQLYQWTADRVATGRDHWRQFVGRDGATREDFYRKKIATDGPRALAPWGKPFQAPKDKASPIIPWIQHNRWVGTCECGGQEVVDPDDPLFFCWGCNNSSNDGRPRPVLFGEREFDAETIMVRRPPENRIWDRHGHLLGRKERIKDLIRESEDHNHRVEPGLKAKYRKADPEPDNGKGAK